jgi:hypothetical protein
MIMRPYGTLGITIRNSMFSGIDYEKKHLILVTLGSLKKVLEFYKVLETHHPVIRQTAETE